MRLKLFDDFSFKYFFDKRGRYPAFQNDFENFRKVFALLIEASSLSLREVEQIIAKMHLVLLATKEDIFIYPALLAFLLVVKETNSELYREYTQTGSTPDKMVEYLYKLFPGPERNESSECARVEGYLIAGKNDRHDSRLGKSLQRHKDLLADENCDESQKYYSDLVVHVVNSPERRGAGVALGHLVNRIEMIENFRFQERES